MHRQKKGRREKAALNALPKGGSERMSEICNECGRSVKLGSGRFVNRVADFNGPDERRAMGKLFPEGDFICAGCDE